MECDWGQFKTIYVLIKIKGFKFPDHEKKTTKDERFMKRFE